MDSLEDILNSLLQNPSNTVYAASGGMMNSPMQNNPMQSTPMSGGMMGGTQQSTPFGSSPPASASPFGSSPPASASPFGSPSMGGGGYGGASMNPYMGGGGTASQLSMGPGAQPYGQGIGGLMNDVNAQSRRLGSAPPMSPEDYKQHQDFVASIEQSRGGQQSQPLYPQQSPFGQGMGGQQSQPLYPQQSPFGQGMGGMGPDMPAVRAGMGGYQQYMMDAAVNAGRLSGMGSAGPSPYQTATPLDPNDPMLARTRGVGGMGPDMPAVRAGMGGGQQNLQQQRAMQPGAQSLQRQVQQQQMRATRQQDRGRPQNLQAATQPYTPIDTTPRGPQVGLGTSSVGDMVEGRKTIGPSEYGNAGRRRLV